MFILSSEQKVIFDQTITGKKICLLTDPSQKWPFFLCNTKQVVEEYTTAEKKLLEK